MENPAELVFALVAAIGTPIDFFAKILTEQLTERGYDSELIHLSSLMDAFDLPTPPPKRNSSAYVRLKTLITRGDELRKKFDPDALAVVAASHINQKRPESEPKSFPGKAFILRQLKHPEEVYRLRSIYEDGLHVLGLYCSARERTRALQMLGLSKSQAAELVGIDEHERAEFGQKFRDTFHLADTFIAVSNSETGAKRAEEQLDRFLSLLFGERIITPTKDECAMNIAHAAALRSASLARQVGASIINEDGDILAVGSNEVPRFGGGSYWERDPAQSRPEERVDARDHILGKDSNDQMQRDLVAEILEELDPTFGKASEKERLEKLDRASEKLKSAGARIMNLTEFGRAVHAEMSALMAAARVGSSVKSSTLFTTTFPCHGCTKHIIDAGIKRVVYVEPYPKSLASEFHNDAISIEDGDARARVKFEPFVGIAPRRYDLFSMKTKEGRETRRKTRSGELEKNPVGLRLTMQPHTYIQREEIAAKQLFEKTQGPGLFPKEASAKLRESGQERKPGREEPIEESERSSRK